MSALLGLATPTIQVNDRTIEYVPNTLSYKGGKGNVEVRFQTAGGGTGSTVITQDAETKVSMIKFDLLTEKTNVELKDEWLELSVALAGNVIRVSDPGFTIAFRNMRITEDPEVSIGSDGKFTVEFKGDPVG